MVKIKLLDHILIKNTQFIVYNNVNQLINYSFFFGLHLNRNAL